MKGTRSRVSALWVGLAVARGNAKNRPGGLRDIDKKVPEFCNRDQLQCDGLVNVYTDIMAYTKLARTKCNAYSEDTFFHGCTLQLGESSSFIKATSLEKNSFQATRELHARKPA